MAFPCLLVEVVGEVVSDYYSGVVEFESLGGVYAAYLVYSVGVVSQRFDLQISSDGILASTLSAQACDNRLD